MLIEESVRFPDCLNDFEDIARLRKHFQNGDFNCAACGNFLKKKQNSTHPCDPDHAIDKISLKEMCTYCQKKFNFRTVYIGL